MASNLHCFTKNIYMFQIMNTQLPLHRLVANFFPFQLLLLLQFLAIYILPNKSEKKGESKTLLRKRMMKWAEKEATAKHI